MPLAHVALAVNTCGWDNSDNIALMVANTLIGSWDRSMGGGSNHPSALAAAASSKNLCHSFQSFNTNYTDTGLWGMYFVAEPLYIWNFIDHLTHEWYDLLSLSLITICPSITVAVSSIDKKLVYNVSPRANMALKVKMIIINHKTTYCSAGLNYSRSFPLQCSPQSLFYLFDGRPLCQRRLLQTFTDFTIHERTTPHKREMIMPYLCKL